MQTRVDTASGPPEPHWLRDLVGRLDETLNDLIVRRWTSAAHIENLARRVILEVRDVRTADVFLPEPGLRSAETFDESLSPIRHAVLSSGIQAARLAAWTTGRMFGWDDRQELLTVAALVRDVGVLVLERTARISAADDGAQEALRIDRRHPSVGAATVSGWRDLSVVLPPLIAGHHERFDGTGYPHGLRLHALSSEQRLLALVDRWVELVNRSGTHPPAEQQAPDSAEAYSGVVRGLYREAEQGEFDLELTVRFLNALGFDPAAINSRPVNSATESADQFSETHDAIGGPHFPTAGSPATRRLGNSSRYSV